MGLSILSKLHVVGSKFICLRPFWTEKQLQRKQWPSSGELVYSLYSVLSRFFSADLPRFCLFHFHLWPASFLLLIEWALSPRPVWIIRFGNAENKSMRIPRSTRTLAHTCNAHGTFWIMQISGSCFLWNVQNEDGGGFSAEINTGFKWRTPGTCGTSDENCIFLKMCCT